MEAMLIIVAGLPGSGKSYFAKQLASELKAVYLNSDRIRKEMLTHSSYTMKEKVAVYEEMQTRARATILLQKTVVADATFFTAAIRKRFLQAFPQAIRYALIEVRADESVIRSRLQHPRVDSEADFQVYQSIKSQWEPIEQPHLVLQSTDGNLAELLQKAKNYLQRKAPDV